ncbi:MAG: HRDC domain-containing protein, partial [Bifidobacteriaceae bacterium]|nr:HRDC domain-containing protein [Bifidobacteriaceae bacterium]
PKQPHPAPWMRISKINVIMKDRRALAVAKNLWEQREKLAQEYDIAPNLLLEDSSIIEAAQRKPHNAREFRSIRCLNERVRMHTGSDQDKMFERYAPIQRVVKPSIWKKCIQEALDLETSKLPRVPKPVLDGTNTNAPKSVKLWKDKHPQRYARLLQARKVLQQIAQDTRTPAEIILKPQYLKNLLWTDTPAQRNIEEFLHEQGARNWQINLVSESLSRVIM